MGDTVKDKWPGYLDGGYFDQNKHLRPEFAAKERFKDIVEALSSSQPVLTMKQLRQFFGHARRLEAKLLAASGQPLSMFHAEFFQLQKIAAYRYDGGGDSRKIPHLFRNFIDENTRTVTNDPDPRCAFLKGFMPHFEALVAYGSLILRKV